MVVNERSSRVHERIDRSDVLVADGQDVDTQGDLNPIPSQFRTILRRAAYSRR